MIILHFSISQNFSLFILSDFQIRGNFLLCVYIMLGPICAITVLLPISWLFLVKEHCKTACMFLISTPCNKGSCTVTTIHQEFGTCPLWFSPAPFEISGSLSTDFNESYINCMMPKVLGCFETRGEVLHGILYPVPLSKDQGKKQDIIN